MSFKKQSEEKILSWLEAGDFNSLGRYLTSGTIHGKPGVPVAELARVEKIIRSRFSEEEQYRFGKILIYQTEYTARNIGARLLVSGWPKHREVPDLAKDVANDKDWIVREYAAGTFAALLEKDFAHFSKLFRQWTKTETVEVKRAIALAVKYDSKSSDPKRLKTYLALIEPLMKEDADYIRKNLGPFAIGDGLLTRFPDAVLKACEKWVRSKNEFVRWNTAMIFTAAAARKHSAQAERFLEFLGGDKVQAVQLAARKARKNLTQSQNSLKPE